MADGLQAPIVPVPDTSALQYVARGLAGMVANRQYQQKIELANQKMVQDAALDQEKFALTRKQLAQQYELQGHQMDSIDAEANLRNAQADYYNNVKSQEVQKKNESLESLRGMTKGIDSIPFADWGTEKGQVAISNVLNDEANAAALDTRDGLRIRQQAWSRQRLAESRRMGDYNIANTAYNKALDKRGITEGALQSLSLDEEGKKVTASGNLWRTNPDGSVYLAAAPGTKETGPARYLTTDEYQAGGKVAAPVGTVFPTLKPEEVSQLFRMKSMVDNYREKLPLSVLQDGTAQQIGTQQAAQQQRAQTAGLAPPSTDLRSRAQQALNDPNATPQEKAAAQQILSQ